MRRFLPCVLTLPILLLTGCGTPEQEVSPDPSTVTETATDDESVPEDPTNETEEPEEGGDAPVGSHGDGSEYRFGEGAVLPHPVGAYEEEFQEGVEEDVVYTVDDVVLAPSGRVGFTLTVEVPELGRVFGTGLLDVRCSYEELEGPATSEAMLGELETGTHAVDMECEAPDSPSSVLISVVNGEDEADFRGPVG
ncbi:MULTISPECIES: hypothetical protein [unclassified Nocardiopsis]|jgi:hypothetical protein|uniref:hypothetical protein n=1 Tax=unclassified Nocardiopsis TaxID=2649073 RepID=UPI00066ECF74|nr:MULTISPECIES: hypothetical protein [unclassified Nocardiopsis]MBQ1079685.1 hypothetical protein [Nocardiopsis sp. B62]